MAMFDFLDKERTIAQSGFNRWLVPPAALAIHLCIVAIIPGGRYQQPGSVCTRHEFHCANIFI
jgi:hypothetical protein